MTQKNSTEIQSQKKYLVVIPTYNEKDNISLLLEAIFKQDFAQKNIPTENVHVLVVDDSSPDKTYEIVREYSKSEPRVHLLLRTNKEGLGRAYVAGFQWGMQNGFDYIIEMDADFSHEPRSLIDLMSALQHSDFVVGSRYVHGGS
jgi:dolichol-phosphate mannosyltransferase